MNTNQYEEKLASLRFAFTFQLMSSHLSGLSLIPQLSFITLALCSLSSSSASYASPFSSNFFLLNSIAFKDTLAAGEVLCGLESRSRNDNANVQSSVYTPDCLVDIPGQFEFGFRCKTKPLFSPPPQTYCLQGSACTCESLKFERNSLRLRFSFQSES